MAGHRIPLKRWHFVAIAIFAALALLSIVIPLPTVQYIAYRAGFYGDHEINGITIRMADGWYSKKMHNEWLQTNAPQAGALMFRKRNGFEHDAEIGLFVFDAPPTDFRTSPVRESMVRSYPWGKAELLSVAPSPTAGPAGVASGWTNVRLRGLPLMIAVSNPEYLTEIVSIQPVQR